MCTQTQTTTALQPVVIDVPKQRVTVTAATRTLQLAKHESIRIVDNTGRPLLDILSTEDGPVLQLAEADTNLDIAGKLRIHADDIEMIARDGELKMLAKDDVIVRGEKVRLN